MPPSSTNLNSRKFAIIVDAGSSGSRSQIYSWDNEFNDDKYSPQLPNVELGLGRELDHDHVPTGWKVEPGNVFLLQTLGK